MTVNKRGYGWTELKPSIRFKINYFNSITKKKFPKQMKDLSEAGWSHVVEETWVPGENH